MATIGFGFLLFLFATGLVYGIDALATATRTRGSWRFVGLAGTVALLGVGALLFFVNPEMSRSQMISGLSALSAGTVLGLALLPPVRYAVAKLMPVDPDEPRDWVGLVALLWLVILRLALFYQGGEEVGSVQVAEAVIQALVLVGIAVALVGLFVRRNARQTLARLGLRKLSPLGLAVSSLAVIPFAAVAALTVLGVEYLQPGTLDRLEDTVTDITGGETSLQFGIMLGITAAVGEETLFRGALQPKYGLIFTSLVFALLHVQYDLLLIVASLLPAGIILGLERKYLGTVAAIVTHALYNTLVVVNGY